MINELSAIEVLRLIYAEVMDYPPNREMIANTLKADIINTKNKVGAS